MPRKQQPPPADTPSPDGGGKTPPRKKALADRAVGWFSGDYFRYVVLPVLLFFLVFVALNSGEIFQPYDPVGDVALNALQVERAKWFQEYLGPYSRYGFHHPGPIAFYYAALVEGLFFFLPAGQLILAQVLLHTLFLLLSLHIVYSSFRPGYQALLFAAAALLALAPLGQWLFLPLWGPALIVTPMIAFVLSAVNVAGGRLRYLLPLVLAGLFVGQTHVGGLVVVVPLTLLALLLFGIRQAVRRPRLERGDYRHAIAAAVLLVVLLVPPLYEQFSTPYGNISRLYDFYVRGTIPPYYAAGQEDTHSLAEGLDLVLSFYAAPAVGILGRDLAYLLPPAMLAAGLLQLRRRHELENYLVLFLLVALTLSVWAASQVVGELLPYLFWFEYAFVALWAFVLFKGAARLACWGWQKIRRPDGQKPAQRGATVHRQHVVGGLATGALLALVPATVVPIVLIDYRIEIPRTQVVSRFTAAIAPRPPRTYLLWWNKGTSSHEQWAVAAGLALRWRQAGAQVCVADPWWEFMFGADLICGQPAGEVYPVLLSADNGATVGSYATLLAYDGNILEAGYPGLPFVLRPEGAETFFRGWSPAAAGRRWAEAADPRVYFFVPAEIGRGPAMELELACGGDLAAPVPLLLNGTRVGEIMPRGEPVQVTVLPIPGDAFRGNSVNELAFLLPAAPGAGAEGGLPAGLSFLGLKLKYP